LCRLKSYAAMSAAPISLADAASQLGIRPVELALAIR